MNKTSNIIYLIIALLAVYFLQGILYASGGIFSQILVVLYLLICGIYFVKTIISKKSTSVSNSIALFIIVLGVSFLLSVKTRYTWSGDTIQSFNNYKAICLALLSFFPFYYFAALGKIQSKTMKLIFIIWLVTSILRFYYLRNTILMEANADADQIVNNTGYMFVLLLPYSMLINNKLLKACSVIICMFFIVLASKRGAILTGLATLAVMYYYYYKQSKSIKNVIIVLCSAAFVGGIGYYLYESNDFLISRFTNLAEGNSSGRDYIYATIWENWLNAPIIYQIFGQGFNASVDIAGKFAHNDWLELLSSLGLVGVILYLYFFLTFFRFNVKVKSEDCHIMLMMILTIWFTTTLFSMAYLNESFYILTVLMGYSIGNTIYSRKMNKEKTRQTNLKH